MQQAGEPEPFIDEILRSLHRTTSDLSAAQVSRSGRSTKAVANASCAAQTHTFYEAVGYMISAQPNKNIQENLIAELMKSANQHVSRLAICYGRELIRLASQWDELMAQANASGGTQMLSNSDNMKHLANILKANVSACVAIGPHFLPQLGKIWVDMLSLYATASGMVSAAVEQQGTVSNLTAFDMPG